MGEGAAEGEGGFESTEETDKALCAEVFADIITDTYAHDTYRYTSMKVQQADMRSTVDTFQAFASSLCKDIKETGNTGAGLTRALQNLMGSQQPKYFNGRPSVDALLTFSDGRQGDI